MGTDTKKPKTNNTGNTTIEANTNIARTRASTSGSSEPVARAIPPGTARKARLASALMSAVVAEQIRK